MDNIKNDKAYENSLIMTGGILFHLINDFKTSSSPYKSNFKFCLRMFYVLLGSSSDETIKIDGKKNSIRL